MKELTIKQKAQRYDEALKRAKNTIEVNQTIPDIVECVESLFPELKESEDEVSEDEKIRKHLITLFKDEYGENSSARFAGIKVKDIIAWLEKQGEQKPTDKVEPKFKNGQWIVWQNKCYKVNYNGCGYELIDQNGLSTSLEYVTVDENAHLWTIKDAKPGDILFHSDSASNGIFIFKELLKYEFSEKVICYCDYDSEDHFCLGEHHTCCWADAKILQPATKEQRNLLFQKMKEAGYEWDDEKKELKKIEPYSLRSIIKDEPSPAIKKVVDSLSAWSEEDESKVDNLCHFLEEYGTQYYGYLTLQGTISWLKSIRPQKQWKPSEKQMDALSNALSLAKNCGEESAFDLRTLYEQLKQL